MDFEEDEDDDYGLYIEELKSEIMLCQHCWASQQWHPTPLTEFHVFGV